MAMPDFHNVEERVKTVLEAYAGLSGVPVGIEEAFPFAYATQKWIGIFLDEVVQAPTEMQEISAGKRVVFRIPIKVVCTGFSLNSHSEAMNQCADVVKNAIEALVSDSSSAGPLADTARGGFVERVDFASVEFDNENGWLRAGVLVMVYDMTGTVS